MRLSVRKAARLAVYDAIMMSVKNHHMPATIRVDTALQPPQPTASLVSVLCAGAFHVTWRTVL
jgi:hypothetical protein